MSSLARMARDFRWGHPRAVPATAPRPVERVTREVSTDWARTPLARGFRAAAQSGVLGPLVRSEVRLTVSGAERLSSLGDTPAVLVMNHVSHLDTAALITALPPAFRSRTVVVAAADYFFTSWWKATGTALVFGTVPIERRGGAPNTTPPRLLAEGWNIIIYPEGTRSHDGYTTRFKPGAAALALAAGAPLVPVALRGAFAAMPRGRSWPAPGRPRVSVLFGDPIHARPGDTPVTLSKRAQAEVERLLDEDETDWWSSLRRVSAGEQPVRSAPPKASWRRSWESTRPVQPAPEPGPRVWSP